MSKLQVEKNYFLTGLALFLIFTAVTFTGRQGPLVELYDYREHVASIREMSLKLLSPGNPLIEDSRPTLRYTPYIFLLAAITKFTPLSLFTVVKIASFCSFILFLAGLYLWSMEYFRDRTMPLYVLVCLLFLWGKPFGYSNEYCLRFFAYTAFYPSLVSFSLSFSGLYFLLLFLRLEKKKYYLYYLFCSAVIFLTHPLTGSFFLLCSFLLVLTEGKCRMKQSALLFAGFAVTGLLALLWPYYPFLEAVAKSTTTAWYDFKMYLYDINNAYRIGPAFLGIPVLLLLLKKRKHLFIVSGFIACSGIYFFGRQMDIFLLDRYIFFIMFFLHLALAWYLRTLGVLSFAAIKKSVFTLDAKSVPVLFFTAVLCISIFYQTAKLGFEQAGCQINFTPLPAVSGYENPLDNYNQVRNFLNTGDIVLSDPLTSWLIPAFTGAKIVALYHNSPMVRDNNIRTQDVLEFYDVKTATQDRKNIIAKYSATHVLLNRSRMKDAPANRIRNYYHDFRISDRLMKDMTGLGKIVFKNRGFILFKIKSA